MIEFKPLAEECHLEALNEAHLPSVRDLLKRAGDALHRKTGLDGNAADPEAEAYVPPVIQSRPERIVPTWGTSTAIPAVVPDA